MAQGEVGEAAAPYAELEHENAALRARLERIYSASREIPDLQAQVNVLRAKLEADVAAWRNTAATMGDALAKAHAEAAVMREMFAVFGTSDVPERIRHLLDVVAKARELQVAYDNWLQSPCILTMDEQPNQSAAIKLGEAHNNLTGAFAVLDDKGKKEQADGEESKA
jgi:hypothetical protein